MYNLILKGAYGRHYATKEQALTDWKAGKDFKIVGGPYCSIRDVATLKARHNNLILSATDGGAKITLTVHKGNMIDKLI